MKGRYIAASWPRCVNGWTMKPEPVAQNVACSVCGLSWEQHKPRGSSVPLSECVRLLKAELARRPVLYSTYTTGTVNCTLSN